MKKGILIALVAAIALAAWWISSGPSVERAGRAAVAPAAPSEVTDASIPVATVQDTAHDTETSRDAAPPASASGLNSALWSRAPEPGAFTPERIENPTKYASIAGLVLDEQGVAIPGAEIRVLLHGGDLSTIEGPARTGEAAREAVLMDLWENEAYRRKAVCDASGAFVLDGIPYTGTAMVTANAPGYTMNTSECALEAETAAEVTLTLRPALAVRGIVVTPSGKPVAGALVDAEGQVGEFASKTDGPTREYLRVRTDERGEFALWMLQFGEPGTMFTAVNVKSAEHGEALFYPVAIGNEEPIRLVLEPESGRVSGTIRTESSQPAAGYHVVLQGEARYAVGNAGSLQVGQGHVYEAVTDRDGHYEMGGVATFLKYSATLFTPAREEVATRELPPVAPNETTVWDYAIAPAIHVTGVVQGMGTETPIPGATVFVLPASGSEDSTPGSTRDVLTTDAIGRFETEITSEEGPYRFVPRNDSFLVASKDEDTLEFEVTAELRAGENPPIVLELPLPWTRQFQLLDQAGQSVEGAKAVEGRPFGERKVTIGRSERTDADGFVAFGLLDPRLETDFIFKKNGYITATAAPALGEPGETRDVEIFVLYQSAGLSARLTGGSGEPLAALPVTCTATYGDRTTTATATTDGEGWLVLDQALPGTEVDLHLEVTLESERKLLQARVDGVSLAAGMMNDLDNVVLREAATGK